MVALTRPNSGWVCHVKASHLCWRSHNTVLLWQLQRNANWSWGSLQQYQYVWESGIFFGQQCSELRCCRLLLRCSMCFSLHAEYSIGNLLRKAAYRQVCAYVCACMRHWVVITIIDPFSLVRCGLSAILTLPLRADIFVSNSHDLIIIIFFSFFSSSWLFLVSVLMVRTDLQHIEHKKGKPVAHFCNGKDWSVSGSWHTYEHTRLPLVNFFPLSLLFCICHMLKLSIHYINGKIQKKMIEVTR